MLHSRKGLAKTTFILVAVLALSAPLAGASSRATVARAKAQAAASPKTASAPKTGTAAKTSARRATTRRASSTTSRTASARARAARESAQPKFKVDNATGAVVPDVRAEAAIIYNPQTHQVLWEENAQSERSIASMTKVMTAIVFLEQDPDYSEQVVIDRADTYLANTTYMRAKELVQIGDLLHALLVASDNGAARTLARVSAWGPEGFVTRMNEKAAELGLTKTHYVDPSGLDAANTSTAFEMAQIIAYASSDERIAQIMRKSEYSFATNRRRVAVHSTNRLLSMPNVDVLAGKTGFISKAGYCFATLLQLPQGLPIAVVVMGARSNAGRFLETLHLFNWLAATSTVIPKPDEHQEHQ